jgi:hypothetical protein
MEYEITATYNGGPDLKKDVVLRRAGGYRHVAGCGTCMFGNYEHDISWVYKQRKAAMSAASRLRMLRLKGVKISMCEYDDE